MVAPSSRGPRVWRWSLRLFAVFLLTGLAAAAFLFFKQHSLLYHPRPYDDSYAGLRPNNLVEIEYTLPIGKQTAYYLPGSEAVPHRLWVGFAGNGSLALDWEWVLKDYPKNGDAFLLVDYPGYGKNSGYASIASTRASADGALHKLCQNLGIREDQIVLGVLGHSLGAAAALDFAAHHRLDRALVVAPFTSLREEAARVVGWPLCYLLVENYDNRRNLERALQENPGLKLAIFHGENDEVIPVGMGRELAREFQGIDFFPVKEGRHVSVLTLAHDQIISWMTR